MDGRGVPTKSWVGKPEGKRSLGRPSVDPGNNIKKKPFLVIVAAVRTSDPKY
jgi:hypothetical protein